MYYFVIKIVDSNLNELSTVMTTAVPGSWYGIPEQPWYRVSGEAAYYNPNWNYTGSIEKWFSTVGGTTDSDYDGAGPGESVDTIIGSDRIYDFVMTIDPDVEKLYTTGEAGSVDYWDMHISPIPAVTEPATMLLVGFGLNGLAVFRRR